MFRGLTLLIIVLAVLAAAAWFSGNRRTVDEFAYAKMQTGVAFESQSIDLGEGVRIHVALTGPVDGEPVMLIHGFPEFWFSWRQQMALLANAGYRVAAPDLRGFNRSSKPKGRDAYSVPIYADDLTKVMDVLGWDAANVAGHDVGAVVAWRLIFNHSDRVKKAVVFNVAQPAALYEATIVNGAKTTSWYRTFFKLPFLPELMLRAGGWRMLSSSMKNGSQEGAFSDADINIYKSAWARDNAISTMLGFYRSGGLSFSEPPSDGAPQMPVMLVIAENDAYLPVEAAEISKKFLGEENVALWPGVSHWTLQEEPARTAALMTAYFKDENEVEPDSD